MEKSQLHCLKCSHDWYPRTNTESAGLPKVCPKCKNPKWSLGPKIPKMGRPAKDKQWEVGINDFFGSE